MSNSNNNEIPNYTRAECSEEVAKSMENTQRTANEIPVVGCAEAVIVIPKEPEDFSTTALNFTAGFLYGALVDTERGIKDFFFNGEWARPFVEVYDAYNQWGIGGAIEKVSSIPMELIFGPSFLAGQQIAKAIEAKDEGDSFESGRAAANSIISIALFGITIKGLVGKKLPLESSDSKVIEAIETNQTQRAQSDRPAKPMGNTLENEGPPKTLEKKVDVRESLENPPSINGIGPAYNTFEEIQRGIEKGEIRENAHVLGVVVKDPSGKIIGQWYEVSELHVGTNEAKYLGHTEQKALARLEEAGLQPESTVELVGTKQPCNYSRGCSTVMSEFAQRYNVDIRYRHVFGEQGMTIHEFTRSEGRITQKNRNEWSH